MARKNKARESTHYTRALHEQAKELLRTTSLPVQDILGVLEIGQEKFYRRFKRREDVNPGEYRVESKPYSHLNDLGYVNSLISDTKLSDRDISCKLGYSETYEFTIAYQKKTGVRPQEYRNKICNNHNEKAEKSNLLVSYFMVSSNPKIQEIVDYINQANLETDDLSGTFLAEIFSYTSQGMSYAFKTATSIKYSMFLQRRRVETAMGILANTDGELNFGKVTKKVGLKNKQAFRELFKAITGETPSDFQLRVRGDVEAKIEQEVAKFQARPLYSGAVCKHSQSVYDDIRGDILKRRDEIFKDTALSADEFYQKVFERIKYKNKPSNNYQAEPG